MRYQRDSGPSIRPVCPTRYILTKYLSLLIFVLLTAPSISFEQQRAFAEEKGDGDMFPVEEGPAKNPKVEEPNPTSPEDDLSVIIGCLKGITNQTAILALQEVADLYTKRAYAGEGGAGRMVKELLDAIALAIKKKENAQTNCELEKPTPQTVAAVVEKVATAAGSIEDFHESVAAMTINILTVQKTAESEEIVEEEEGGKDSDNKTKEETYQKIGTNSFDTLAYQVDSTAVAEATDFSEIEG